MRSGHTQLMAVDSDAMTLTPDALGVPMRESVVLASILSGWKIIAGNGHDQTTVWREFLKSQCIG